VTRSPIQLVIRFSAVLMVLLSLAGCAVGMAAAGKEPPNLAACRIGASVVQIERELGAPVRSRDLPDGGQECIYEYELGNAPSPGRAVGHAALDVVTLGLWEIIGTPLEMMGGSKYQLIVVYDADGHATEITSRRID
jgi:hypothetical protein